MRRPWVRRRWLRVGLGVTCSLIVGLGLTVYACYPRIGEWAIRSKVVGKLEAKLDREVSVGSIDVDRSGHAVLRNVVISGPNDGDRPLVRIDKVSVDYSFWGSLKGEMRVEKVVVEGVHGAAVRHPDGSDNFSDILRRYLGGGDGDEPPETVSASLRPKTLIIKGGAGDFRDSAAGLTVTAGDIALIAEQGGLVQLTVSALSARTAVGPEARLGTLVVSAEYDDLRATAAINVAGGSLRLWPGMTLSGIHGDIAEADKPGKLWVDLKGSYGGADEELWTVEGWLDPRKRTASLDLKADRFELKRVSRVFRESMVVDYEATSMDANFHLEYANGRGEFDGEFGVRGLNVFHPMLAEKPVRDIEVSGPVVGSFDRRARTVQIHRADLKSRGVDYQLTGAARMPGGIVPETGARRPAWHVSARLIIPPLPCQKMLNGIPKELVSYIHEAKMRGTFKSNIYVDIDWADLDATKLGGSVGIRKCRVDKMPGTASAERLRGVFDHYVELERDKWMAFELGPENPDFVSIHDVSPFLIKSLMTTEDSRFYRHRGFIVREFKSALIKNLKKGYFVFGASSITMQMVKNVILYREKTVARKLQELFLTWYVETKLSKDRILEIYVNAIEFGPALYGIGPAAQHYFGKHPRDLNPVEAAWFSSILPSPKSRYRQFCRDKLWRTSEAKIRRILKLMHKRKRLTDDEYAAVKDMPLVFDRTEAPGERECYRKVRNAIKNSRPTNPMKK